MDNLKANHQKEPFSEKKVRESIIRARIPQELQSQVMDHIKSKIYDGISTSEIYRHILEFLHQSPQPYSRARYSLKEAIMMLGPTGYPFEDFIAKLFEALGYKTLVRQILTGRCISHEIDVVAEKNGRRAMIEAKFHNSSGTRSDIQVALYTKARFDDIKERNSLSEAWIVTNTKTTTDAEIYSHCVNMKVISWSYPKGEGLRELIEKHHLFPITTLTTLNQNLKQTLLTNHTVLCKDIKSNPKLLDILPLSKEEKEKTINEINFMFNEDRA